MVEKILICSITATPQQLGSLFHTIRLYPIIIHDLEFFVREIDDYQSFSTWSPLDSSRFVFRLGNVQQRFLPIMPQYFDPKLEGLCLNLSPSNSWVQSCYVSQLPLPPKVLPIHRAPYQLPMIIPSQQRSEWLVMDA